MSEAFLDPFEASYTCRECLIKSVVTDREGEVCVQCGLRQTHCKLDFHPYALRTEEGDDTVQHEDQRSSLEKYLTLFREVVSSNKHTLMDTRIGLEPTEHSGTLGKSARGLSALHEAKALDNHVRGFQRGQELMSALLRYLMIRCGIGDDMHKRICLKSAESWYQYCVNLVSQPVRKPSQSGDARLTRFFRLDLEAVALAMVHVMIEGIYVDLDMVIEFVRARQQTREQLTVAEFKTQLGLRVDALRVSVGHKRVSTLKRRKGACHSARASVKLGPSQAKESELHFAAVRYAAEKAVGVFVKQKSLSETQQQAIWLIASSELCPQYVRAFEAHSHMEKLHQYLMQRASMIGTLIAREAFARWAPSAAAGVPTELRFKAKRAAVAAKQFKRKTPPSSQLLKITRQDLPKACPGCTISRVTQLLKRLSEMNFDLRGHQ